MLRVIYNRWSHVRRYCATPRLWACAYGSGPMLDWLVEKRGIAPHIPVIDKSGGKDGTFERADFTFDAENDLYICPNGKELKSSRRAFKIPRPGANKDATICYRARKRRLRSMFPERPVLPKRTAAQSHQIDL